MKQSIVDTVLYIALLVLFVLFCFGGAVLLGFAVGGCCPAIDPEEPIHFDETFTDVELTQLLSATAEWSVAMDRDMPPLFYDEPHGWQPSHWLDERSVVHRMTEGEAATLRDVATITDERVFSENFVGLASPGGSVIIAIERLSIDNLAAVMRHELGHRYGCLGHSPAPSLMVGTLSKDLRCIDFDTIEQVCDVNDCGPNWGPTCQ